LSVIAIYVIHFDRLQKNDLWNLEKNNDRDFFIRNTVIEKSIFNYSLIKKDSSEDKNCGYKMGINGNRFFVMYKDRKRI
jgi:hypothetical protein